ncbi:MAG TPA: chorismate synthase [Myxococcales bacterium]|nr:chorismate synthase [Myxococcales bacterium]HAN31392.1 chorismate synthase [Myxococcales bacterium]
MLTRLRMLTAGESHGPKLTGILEGIPAGLEIDFEGADELLARRQRGYGAGGRMKIERDRLHLTGGYMQGATTGGPLCFEIVNRDWSNWRDRDVAPMNRPRPGHADLTGAIKYGYGDLRLSLERSSARETAMRVAAGAICIQLLETLGVSIGGWVRALGGVDIAACDVGLADVSVLREQLEHARSDEMAAPISGQRERLRAEVKRAMKAKDTLGGLIEVVALGLPAGLGSYVQWDRRLDARIAGAILSIQAMKGVEIGEAFTNCRRDGTEVHDEIIRDQEGEIGRRSNRAGGVEGGITTAQPLWLRVAMKPISTTLNPRQTVDLVTGQPSDTQYERSDICALPRAVPICESMLALVLADALLEKLGGDSLAEVKQRLDSLRRSHLDDLKMNNESWRIGYQER